jgi:hypothetical protein
MRVGQLLSQPERTGLWHFAKERRLINDHHHNAAQHTAMSTSQADVAQHHHVTPPPSLTDQPSTPPLTDKKPFAGALRVIALFKEIQAGRNIKQDTQIDFKLAEGEYGHIERTLQQDDVLSGYVQDKIRLVDLRHGED